MRQALTWIGCLTDYDRVYYDSVTGPSLLSKEWWSNVVGNRVHEGDECAHTLRVRRRERTRTHSDWDTLVLHEPGRYGTSFHPGKIGCSRDEEDDKHGLDGHVYNICCDFDFFQGRWRACNVQKTQHYVVIRTMNGRWRNWTTTLECSIRVGTNILSGAFVYSDKETIFWHLQHGLGLLNSRKTWSNIYSCLERRQNVLRSKLIQDTQNSWSRIVVCKQTAKKWTHLENMQETDHAQSNFHGKFPHHTDPTSCVLPVKNERDRWRNRERPMWKHWRDASFSCWNIHDASRVSRDRGLYPSRSRASVTKTLPDVCRAKWARVLVRFRVKHILKSTSTK